MNIVFCTGIWAKSRSRWNPGAGYIRGMNVPWYESLEKYVGVRQILLSHRCISGSMQHYILD